MAYDRADWHYGGDFPEDLPSDAGGTHIGMFLAWAITRQLEGDLHRDESADALKEVRERRIGGRDFLSAQCDEKFWEEDLNDVGNEFTKAYYSKEGPGGYFTDYDEVLGEGLPSLYHVEDKWANFDKLAPRLDQRFQEWKGRRN